MRSQNLKIINRETYMPRGEIVLCNRDPAKQGEYDTEKICGENQRLNDSEVGEGPGTSPAVRDGTQAYPATTSDRGARPPREPGSGAQTIEQQIDGGKC